MADASGSDPSLSPLPGSERRPARGARVLGAADPDAQIEATLVLRRRQPLPDDLPRLTPAQLADDYGADPADLDAVGAALDAAGITLVSADLGTRLVRVRGTVAALERTFGTRLEQVESTAPDGAAVQHRQRTGDLSVPSDLAGVVVAVLGLDDRPQARAQFRTASPRAVSTAYTPLQLGAVYRFPDGDGAGTSVAIVELGGGYRQADLTAYFSGLGVAQPVVRAVAVDGGTNAPTGDPDGPDGEVLLDIEVVGALVPGADIAVYFAPNTDAGFLTAITRAAHASPTPAAISISWGQSEDQWTAQARAAFDAALADAAALGVVTTVAAGDNGSTDGTDAGGSHVDFPASSPHALGCGGTSLHASGTTVRSETVWNDGSGRGATGGGVSRHFPLPDYQADAGVPAAPAKGGGRGVPDVAGDADPETGYRVRIDGQDTVIGGTSAVAPLWAALVARLVQAIGTRIGPLQPTLYGATTGFRDITSGSNGAYSAGPGWDPCTGLGVPDGEALLQALRG